MRGRVGAIGEPARRTGRASGRGPSSATALALLVGAAAFVRSDVAAADDDVPTRLDPGDTDPAPRGAPPDPYAPSERASRDPSAAEGEAGVRQRQPAGEARPEGGAEGSEAQEGGGFYYHDHGMARSGRQRPAERPSDHEVVPGDTLWGITALYFGDPFQWPEVWAENPHITNPHWIFPGDEISLGDPEGDEGAEMREVAGDVPGEGDYGLEAEGREAESPLATSFRLRQTAFIDRADLDPAAVVAGAPTERKLLVRGDTLYLDRVAEGELEPGESYAIYADTNVVEHPDSGDVVGAYVELLGELEVLELRDGERAVATITSSVDVVERGARVGPLAQRFAEIEPEPPRADVRGTIVGTLDIAELVGPNHLVILDRGETAGVEVGNPFYVVRRGDGRSARMDALAQVGQDDEGFPPRVIGQIHVVEVSGETSLGWVTSSAVEIGRGDRVIMREDLR